MISICQFIDEFAIREDKPFHLDGHFEEKEKRSGGV
jgi:hypothetical protein